MKICLTKEDCYCSIPRLYDNIARKLGYDLAKVNYDCREITVSGEVFKQVDSYCKEVENLDSASVGMLWCIYGPRAVEELSNYDVDITENFIKEVE